MPVVASVQVYFLNLSVNGKRCLNKRLPFHDLPEVINHHIDNNSRSP